VPLSKLHVKNWYFYYSLVISHESSNVNVVIFLLKLLIKSASFTDDNLKNYALTFNLDLHQSKKGLRNHPSFPLSTHPTQNGDLTILCSNILSTRNIGCQKPHIVPLFVEKMNLPRDDVQDGIE
jgi:hypothetical protein